MKNIGCKKHMSTKAISPVIATVIIVSVAIAIAVAVAFWMTGITGLFTRYEKLDIVSAYAIVDDDNSHFYVILNVKNTGTTSTTIDNIFINAKPMNSLTGVGADTQSSIISDPSAELSTEASISESLDPGDEVWIGIDLGPVSNNPNGFTHGQIIEVKLHTAAGNEYPRSVELP